MSFFYDISFRCFFFFTFFFSTRQPGHSPVLPERVCFLFLFNVHVLNEAVHQVTITMYFPFFSDANYFSMPKYLGRWWPKTFLHFLDKTARKEPRFAGTRVRAFEPAVVASLVHVDHVATLEFELDVRLRRVRLDAAEPEGGLK